MTDRLGKDDQGLWKNYHKDLCPGMAKADLQGDGRASYALVLLKGTLVKRVILLNDHGHFHETVLSSSGGAIFVVHAAQPGIAYEFGTKRHFDLPHASFVFEVMEATATQYYWQDRQIRSVLISD